MSSIYRPFDTYRIWHYSGKESKIHIQLYNGSEYIGSIHFKEDSGYDNLMDELGHITLYFQNKEYLGIVDFLRNESPLFLWYNPEEGVGGIANDAKEPVGEGEED